MIALPLQRKARNNGNNVFIDETFVPYGDQWSFLSSIRKIGIDELERHITHLGKGDELGSLHIEPDEKDDKPWQIKLPLDLRQDLCARSFSLDV